MISADGRIAAHAFEKVPIALSADGGAEQVPAGLVGRHRRRGPAGRGRQRRGPRGDRGRRLHRAVVGHRGRRRRRVGHRPLHHLAGLAGRRAVQRDRARGAERPGLLGHEGGPLGPAHRRHPHPVGQGPGGPHPLPARGAPGGLRRHRGVPRAGGLPQPAADRVGPGLARLHHAALGHRQPRHQRHRLRRQPVRAGGARAAHPARPRADGQRPRRADARRRRRAGPARRHPGRRRHG